MLSRALFAMMVLGMTGTLAVAQDSIKNPERGTDFATVGRVPVPTALGGRCYDRLRDSLDRHPCCGYGKTHNDMGVPGYRSTISFYWGGACEYFREDCRRPTPSTESRSSRNGAQRMMDEMFGGGCSSCGK